MNRELKFRAWIKSHECMIELKPAIGKYDFEDGFVLSFVVDGYEEFGAHERYDVAPDNMFVMQYTGLKDKNGKEIYEGDIVKHPLSVPPEERGWIIGFDLFTFNAKRIGGSEVVIQMNNYFSSCEVIGNIYEHPELLEAQ